MKAAVVRAVIAAAALAGLAGSGAARAAQSPVPPAADAWVAKRIFDVYRNEARCVLETPKQVMHDGHQDTSIFLRVDGGSLQVMTESNVDLGHGDVGIRIDGGNLIKPDKAYLDQNALFESSAARVIAQFKAGLEVEVSLRFWPTWPNKGLKTVRFSLLGFSRAFARLPGC